MMHLVKLLYFLCFFEYLTLFDGQIVAQPSHEADRKLTMRAFVLGVGNYPAPNKLNNPENDARDLGATLKLLHFDPDVYVDENAANVRRHITAWISAIPPSCDIALFYFAGHGLQIDGENYIFPTDGDNSSQRTREVTTFRVSSILDQMKKSGAKLNVIILDACRYIVPRGITASIFKKGLAAMNPTGNGTLICFSTEAGKTSSDGTLKGGHSEYTQALLEYLSIPNLPILTIFERVHDEVFENKGIDQNPCIYSSVGSQFNFCLSIKNDGIHQSAVYEQASLVDSFRKTQVPGSTKDKDQLFDAIIRKFDSVLNAATKVVTDSLKDEQAGFAATGNGADFEKYTYGATRGLETRFSGKKSVWASFDVNLIGAVVQVKIWTNYAYNAGDESIKKLEQTHSLNNVDTLEYSAFAINWREIADHITQYYLARALVIKR